MKSPDFPCQQAVMASPTWGVGTPAPAPQEGGAPSRRWCRQVWGLASPAARGQHLPPASRWPEKGE